MTDVRAQSETLGFVLVFALMVASIGIVYTTGFSGLQDVRDVERVNNAERAFEVLADNIEDITLRGAPSRATEIKLADARLFLDESSTIEVNPPDTGFNESYTLRPIVYDASTGSTVVFEQGAVLRRDGNSGLVRHESTILLNGSRTVIPIVKTRVSGNTGVDGSATVLVRTDHSQTDLTYQNDTPDGVWMNVTSPRADLWRDYFQSKPKVNCEPLVANTAHCHIETDSVAVSLVRINVALE